MTDAVEAVGQDVQQKAADEFAGTEGHDFAPSFAVGAVILVFEADARATEREQPGIGNGDAVGVAGEVSEHRLWPREWGLGIDIF